MTSAVISLHAERQRRDQEMRERLEALFAGRLDDPKLMAKVEGAIRQRLEEGA